MKKFLPILSFVVLGLAIYSCKKDQVYKSMTPYQLDIPSHFPAMQIPGDNPMTVEGVELGRYLFYETRLSRDNSISCASCHLQEHGFSDPNKFSQGVDGALGDRQSMALVNLGWQTSFFWDGRSGTLEEQILEPIPNPVEMHQEWPDAIAKLRLDTKYPRMFRQAFGEEGITKEKVTKSIAQFLRTMISGKSKYDVMYKFQNGLALSPTEQTIWENITVQEWAGMDIFQSLNKGDCIHCHDGALMHVNLFSNNGLDMTFTDEGRYLVTGNPNDRGKFKVPSLRNIEYTAPYMHDGRFNTLDEVTLHYSFGVVNSPTIDPMMEFAHQGGVQLDLQERELLKIFLQTFSDEEFLNNPKFKTPF